MNAKISRHTKDIIQKHANGLFRNATLEFYGVKTAKIKELVSVELPVVEVAETSMDFVLLLEDDSYLNLEFQSSHKESDLERFASYNLLEVIKMTDLATLLVRDALEEGKQVRDLEIAKNMISKGFDVCLIEEMTGLSLEQIEKLKSE